MNTQPDELVAALQALKAKKTEIEAMKKNIRQLYKKLKMRPTTAVLDHTATQCHLEFKKWTPEEIAYLKNNYSHKTAKVLAAELGVSINIIYSKASRLFLPKKILRKHKTAGSPEWNKS